jgi:hypothetical protein
MSEDPYTPENKGLDGHNHFERQAYRQPGNRPVYQWGMYKETGGLGSEFELAAEKFKGTVTEFNVYIPTTTQDDPYGTGEDENAGTAVVEFQTDQDEIITLRFSPCAVNAMYEGIMRLGYKAMNDWDTALGVHLPESMKAKK